MLRESLILACLLTGSIAILPAAGSSFVPAAQEDSCTYAFTPGYEAEISLSSRIRALEPSELICEYGCLSGKAHLTFRQQDCADSVFKFGLRFAGNLGDKPGLEPLVNDYQKKCLAVLFCDKGWLSYYYMHLYIFDLETKRLRKKIGHSIMPLSGECKLSIHAEGNAVALATGVDVYIWALTKEFEKNFAEKRVLIGKNLYRQNAVQMHKSTPVRIFENIPHQLDRAPIFREEDDLFCADRSAIRRLDVIKGTLEKTYFYGTGSIIDFDCLGKHLIATGSEGARIWDISTGRLLQRYQGSMIGNNIRFSDDAEHIVVGSSEDLATYCIWHKIHAHDERYSIVKESFSPDACPELYPEIKSRLLSCIDKNPANKATVYAALAQYCRTVAAVTGDSTQCRFYISLAEKYSRQAQVKV